MTIWLERLTIIAVTLAGLVLWYAILNGRLSLRRWGKDASPVMPRWGLVDIGFIAVAWFFCHVATSAGVAVGHAMGWWPLDVTSPAAHVAQGCAQLAATLLGLAFLTLRHPANLRALLGRRDSLAGYILIGLVVFAMWVPVVWWLQLALVEIVPYHHDTLQLVEENPHWSALASAWLAAVFAAPIAEEFFFRGLLQGWIARTVWTSRHGSWRDALLGQSIVSSPRFAPDAEAGSLATSRAFNGAAEPTVATTAATTIGLPEKPADQPSLAWPTTSWLPVLFSSVLFGAVHWNQGLAPISLTVLGLALGYTYHKTGSMVPCIVVHFLVNATAMSLTTLDILAR
jgi:membrane protease YdiL (CAAX protease family)